MPGRVLIIDDDRDACDLVCAYLASAGYETEVRFDGPSALAAFRQHPFDVVVTDIMMPSMDGLEVLRELKTIDPDVGVIILSAIVEDRTRVAIDALRGGAADYFAKQSLDLAELERAVGRAAARRAAGRDRDRRRVELEHLARTDPLTGLANRLELDQRLREEFSRLGRGEDEFALAILDVDGFKTFNDSFGHLVGDQVLRSVAAAVRDNCRAYDVKARLGGDEFVVVMPDTTLDQGLAVAEKIRRAVGARVHSSDGASVAITLSAGVTSTTSKEGITPDGLIRRADEALYEAKRAGRNRTVRIAHGGPTADVLVIEDDAAEAEAIVRMCEILGCRADWTRTASAGIERARLCRYGLALVGLDLPDMPGHDALDRIKELSPGTSAAIMTNGDPAGLRALEAGSRFPITITRKPMTIEHLKSLLSEARRRT